MSTLDICDVGFGIRLVYVLSPNSCFFDSCVSCKFFLRSFLLIFFISALLLVCESLIFLRKLLSRTEPKPVRDNNFLKKIRVGRAGSQRQEDREKEKKHSIQRGTNKETSQAQPVWRTEHFCEQHTLSEPICRKKHVFRSRFRDSDLGSFSIVDLVQTRNPICLVAD